MPRSLTECAKKMSGKFAPEIENKTVVSLISLIVAMQTSADEIDSSPLRERLSGGIWEARSAHLRCLSKIVRQWAAEAAQ